VKYGRRPRPKLTVILESRAICRYLATKYNGQGTSLIPDAKDVKATALFDQWQSVEAFDFDPFASELVAQKLFYKLAALNPS
jgi:glutathione S-transferase